MCNKSRYWAIWRCSDFVVRPSHFLFNLALVILSQMAQHVSKSLFPSCTNYFTSPSVNSTRAGLRARWQVQCPVSAIGSWSRVSFEAELEVSVVRQ